MAQIDEIAPDLFRICVFFPEFDLQFNHFVVRDEEPLLFHTGMRRTFPEVREAVARIVDPAALRWISWSHFEVDECGALNEWLAVSPHAQAICTEVGAAVNIMDFADRPPRGMRPGETIDTGRHRYQLIATPQLPHGWDAGMLYEEKHGILLCSDLFHQLGECEPITTNDIVGRFGHAIATYQQHPVLMDYMPFTSQTRRQLEKLAALKPRLIAAMHGSSFEGDGASALLNAADVMQRHLGGVELAASYA
jgi:flavorubredoxin